MNQTITIQELCRLSGVSRRTIHFYLQQGILPPPDGNGPAARYGDQHVIRLRLIPLLKAQGERLDQIRRQFTSSGLDELQDLEKILKTLPASPEQLPVNIKLHRHYQISPGIELVTAADLSPALQEKVDNLLQTASQIFK